MAKTIAHNQLQIMVLFYHSSLFEYDGVSNMYQKPAWYVFKNSILKAKKLMKCHMSNSHSPGPAAEGENYLPHLAFFQS